MIFGLNSDDKVVGVTTFKDSLSDKSDVAMSNTLNRFGYRQCSDSPDGYPVIAFRSRFVSPDGRPDRNKRACSEIKALLNGSIEKIRESIEKDREKK